jgi:hypothetical protein
LLFWRNFVVCFDFFSSLSKNLSSVKVAGKFKRCYLKKKST